MQDKLSLTKLLARGTSINLFGFVFRTALVFLHSFVATRLFGAAIYGEYTVGLSVVMVLAVVTQIGFQRTLIRFVAEYYANGQYARVKALLKLVFLISLPITIIVVLVLFIATDEVAALFGGSTLANSLPVFAIALPLLTLATLLSAFSQGFKHMRYKVYSFDILRPGIEFGAVVILAFVGFSRSRLSLPLAYALSVGGAALALIYFTRKALYPRLQSHVGEERQVLELKPLLRPIFSFSAPVWVLNLLTSMTQRAGFLLLGALGTTTMVGILGILQRLIGFSTAFLISTNLIFAPIVADLVSRRRYDEFAQVYRSSTRWIFAISLPFFIILGFFGAEILSLFGQEFVDGYIPLLILIGAGVVTVATGSNVTLTMSGYPHYTAINEALNLGLVIVLGVWLIPEYGLLGAVSAITAGMVTTNVLQVVQIWLHLRVQPYNWDFAKVVLAGLGSVLVTWLAKQLLSVESWYAFVFVAMLAVMAYLGLLFGLGLTEEETAIVTLAWQRARQIIASILRRVRSPFKPTQNTDSR